MDTADLPALNASLNAIAATFLLLGWFAIKQNRARLHMKLMVAALACSTLFLISYLVYHALHGSTPYQGEGAIRILYFFILLTHIPLAAAVVPASLAAVWFAFRKRYKVHVRITRLLWPAWMYVSITGVLIYLMLYVL